MTTTGRTEVLHAFMLQVNQDEPAEYVSAFSQYSLAVLEAFGALGMPYPCTVKIWSPDLVPEYGPYTYRIGDFVDMNGRQYVTPSVQSVDDSKEPNRG